MTPFRHLCRVSPPSRLPSSKSGCSTWCSRMPGGTCKIVVVEPSPLVLILTRKQEKNLEWMNSTFTGVCDAQT